MKSFKTVTRTEMSKLTCDSCGLEASADEGNEFSEFINIEHSCFNGAIHGDGSRLSIDLCQHCFAGMCGDMLTIISPVDNQPTNSPESVLEYHNIYHAITQSKQDANKLKQACDIKISARDILSAKRISTPKDLKIALKRVEQLWDAQYHSAQGSELNKLADLICAYEKKSWDSYFAQVPLADDDFMPERLNINAKISFNKMGTVTGQLSKHPINNDVDENRSCPSSVVEENTHLSRKVMSQVELNTNKTMPEIMLKTIEKLWAKYPDLRLTQLLVNVIMPSESCPEIYYIEDSKLIKLLDKFMTDNAETL
tara:strand:+ start:5244 stop:6176 length:933 start_codon:yes stop_codon:yes gene_type:complete